MNHFSPLEITQNYCSAGVVKTQKPLWQLLLLGVMGGMIIALGGLAASIVSCGLEPSPARLAAGLIFPFGLGIILLGGFELFTGNCLICISVLEKKATCTGMLRNWVVVYLGNLLGGLLVAGGYVFTGKVRYGVLVDNLLKTAVLKCEISFFNGVVLGFFCNLLVCLGVVCALSAKDTTGKLLGAYLPVGLFVMAGYEHCVANMFYIPAGLFIKSHLAVDAAAAGLELSALTWGNFIFANLLPVTIGNILGGCFLGLVLWSCHLYKKEH